MGVEDEIRDLLYQGFTPQTLIQQHNYRKSTVYKVYNNWKTKEVRVTESAWAIENIKFSKTRYLPGDNASLSYRLVNKSAVDFYVYQAGIQPEWLYQEQIWYPQDTRFLLRPGEMKALTTNCPIPEDLLLGEYEIRFGAVGNFLAPGAAPSSLDQTQWTDPVILDVKRPLMNYEVFLSHSTEDMSLVRQVKRYLDNEGITVVIAEDIKLPGAVLEDKFKSLIKESQCFLALFTDSAIRSKMVILETNYAIEINKPRILLKEESVELDSPIEWTKFSRYEPVEDIAEKGLEAIRQLRTGGESPPTALVIGLLALLAGVLIGVSKQKG